MSSDTGTAPGLDLKANRGPYLFWVCIAGILLSTLAVGMRFAARKAAQFSILLDDWTILIALPCVLMPCILDLYCTTRVGFGKHIQALDASSTAEFKTFWFHLWISNLLYSTSTALVKISILLYIHRNFPVRTLAIYAMVLGGMVLLWGFVSVLTTVFSCYPIRGFWDQTVQHKCINNFEFALGTNIPNIFFDVAIMALPLGWLWKMSNVLSQKIALGLVYGLAGFVVAMGALRLQSLVEYATSSDYTWDFIPIAVLTTLETNAALICACLPALNPLLQFSLHGSFAPSPEVRTRPNRITRQDWPAQQRDLSAEEAGELARITGGEAPRRLRQSTSASGGLSGGNQGTSQQRAAKKKSRRWTFFGGIGDSDEDARAGLEPPRRARRGFMTPKESRFSDW